jgi:hypothetical protein
MIDFPQCSGSGPRWPDPNPLIHNTGMDLDPSLGPSFEILTISLKIVVNYNDNRFLG